MVAFSNFLSRSRGLEAATVATYGVLCALQISKRSFFGVVLPAGVVEVAEPSGVEPENWKPVFP